MTIIRALRLARGLTPEALAASAGISLAEYHDLEHHPDELHIAASVETLARIAQHLGVKPSVFYGGTASGTISLDELVRRILKHLDHAGGSVAELEASVGWDLAAALESPSRFRDFPADGLRDVCSHVGVDWLGVLDGLAI
jgi:transcriptional regulator with XRE-family HTH domain